MRLFDRPGSGEQPQSDRQGRRVGRHRRGQDPAQADAAAQPQKPQWARQSMPYASPPRAPTRSGRPQPETGNEVRRGAPPRRKGGAARRGDGRGEQAQAREAPRSDQAQAKARPQAPTERRGAQNNRAEHGEQRRRVRDSWPYGQPRDQRAGPADRQKMSWRDFELGNELPRARPHPPDAPDRGDGRRHCGSLENILYRQWDHRTGLPTPEVVRAVDSLAKLPQNLKDKLAEGLDAIYIGMGGVPELDDMQHLRGVGLPSSKATWDVCAGAYGDRKIVVGDQPSPTPDVMFHEIGHALDDVDGRQGDWQSDSEEFRALYEQCQPRLAGDFHKQAGDLGRREFFADAFAAIASRQRPALLDMLGGDTRTALNVMLFFNRHYGI